MELDFLYGHWIPKTMHISHYIASMLKRI